MNLAEYRKTLRELHKIANEAIIAGDMDRHFEYARKFHTIADECKEQHGVELREEFAR